jgi:hypothetical protein
MAELTAQTVGRYLNDLAHGHNSDRLKPAFQNYPATGENVFLRMNNELGDAYWVWHSYQDGDAALTHLESVMDICHERLSSAYKSKYDQSVAFFQGSVSRAGTPPQAQGQHAHLQNLLVRVTACLH